MRKIGRKNRISRTNIKTVYLNLNISIIRLNVKGLNTPTVRMDLKKKKT